MCVSKAQYPQPCDGADSTASLSYPILFAVTEFDLQVCILVLSAKLQPVLCTSLVYHFTLLRPPANHLKC